MMGCVCDEDVDCGFPKRLKSFYIWNIKLPDNLKIILKYNPTSKENKFYRIYFLVYKIIL